MTLTGLCHPAIKPSTIRRRNKQQPQLLRLLSHQSKHNHKPHLIFITPRHPPTNPLMFSTLKARSRSQRRPFDPFNIPFKSSTPNTILTRAVAMSGTKRSISEMEKSSNFEPKFVVFASDALIDGREAIANVITKLFTLLKPELQPLPTKSEILQVYANSPLALSDVFAKLGHTIESQSEMDIWAANYSRLYAEEQMHLYDDAKAFLTKLKVHNIPIVILTTDADNLISMISQANLQHHVDLVVNQLPYFMQNLDVFQVTYHQEVFIRAAQYHAARAPSGIFQMGLADALFVTCTPKIVALGKVVEAQTCLVKKTDEGPDCIKADIVVEDLAGLGEYIFGSAEAEARSKILRISEEVNVELEVMEVSEQVNGEPDVMEVDKEVNVESEVMEVTEVAEGATERATNGVIEVVTGEVIEE